MSAQDDLSAILGGIAQSFSGELSASATNLVTGDRVQFNADTAFPVASVIKLPILVALLRVVEQGHLDLDTRIVVRETDQVPGSGVLKLLTAGLRPTIGDLAMLMTAVSDNTAANLVIEQIGGISVVNDAMAELGLRSVQLRNRVDFDIVGLDISLLGVASSTDLDRLAFLIANGMAFSATISAAAERIMSNQQYLDQVLRYIKVAPYSEELRIVQPIVSASKTGFHPGVRADAGIVRFKRGGFSYAVATKGSQETRFSPEDEGEIVAGRIGRLLSSYWWPAENGETPIIDSPYVGTEERRT